MTFGEKLYQLRKQHGFSQEVLAEKLNTSRQAVSKWENNNGYPETEKLILLARLFQVSLDDLLMEERDIGLESYRTEDNMGNLERDKTEKDGYYVNRETASGFLLYYKKKFLLLGAGCGILAGCNAVRYSSTEPGFFELAVWPALDVVSGLLLLAIVLYIILKQNPYRNLRKKELIFAADVKKELQEEFSKVKVALLAGIVICMLIVGISEMQFACSLDVNWEAMYLMSEVEMLRDAILQMILMGICGFVTVFCVGVYWSYAVLLRMDWQSK